MKKNSILALSVVFSLLSSGGALASQGKGDKEGPCHQIRQACEAAGFLKGGHKKDGKGLWVDCIGKLKNGETVPGVTVTTEQVSACKDKVAKRKAKKAS